MAKSAPTLSAKLVAEFIGTFILVFTACNNNMGGGQLASLSVAASLMVGIYSMGSVSGAHFNPAVSAGLALARFLGHGDFDCGHCSLYVVVQLAAGVSASLCSGLLWGTDLGGPTSHEVSHDGEIMSGNKDHPARPLGSPGDAYALGHVMCAEAIYTALLVFVVLNVATCGDESRGGLKYQKNQYFGLAIGLCIVAGATAIGHISGCSLNPAVSIGVSMGAAVFNDKVSFSSMLPVFAAYAAAEFAGACLAVGAFFVTRASLLNGEEVSMLSKMVSEMLGTFMLVLTVCLVVATPGEGNVLGVVGIAASLIVMVYSTAAVSGANLNPAVSFALLLTKNLKIKEFGFYVVAQMVGGILAVCTAAFLQGKWLVSLVGVSGHHVAVAKGSWAAVACSEAFYTFLLVFVVLNSVVRNGPNQYYGLAIGMCIVAGGVAVGGLSGGCFNPAVALSIDFGGILDGKGMFGTGLVFAVSEMLGATLAAIAYKVIGKTEEVDEEDDQEDEDSHMELMDT